MTAETEVRAGYEWLSQFVTQEDWSERRRKIQSHLLAVARPHDSPIGSEEFRSVCLAADRFGWYLHLAETYLDRKRHTQDRVTVDVEKNRKRQRSML